MQQNTDVKKGQTVRIAWKDSAHMPGWQPPYSELVYGHILSAGIVCDNDQAQVIIAVAVNEEDSPLSPLAIPWDCIDTVEVL